MEAQQTFQVAGSGSIPISPHQLLLKVIQPWIACQLNKRWHSRLPRIHWSNVVRNTHHLCYGIYFEELAIGVAIWTSPVAQNRFKDGKRMLELRRLALSDKCPKNSASRVISIMVKHIRKKFPEITRLISYQDTFIHAGTIYKASNWKQAGTTKFITWENRNKTHNPDQTIADKIRWEYQLQ